MTLEKRSGTRKGRLKPEHEGLPPSGYFAETNEDQQDSPNAPNHLLSPPQPRRSVSHPLSCECGNDEGQAQANAINKSED